MKKAYWIAKYKKINSHEALAKYGGKIEMKYDVKQILNMVDVDKDYSNNEIFETDNKAMAQIRNSQEILNIIDCI